MLEVLRLLTPADKQFWGDAFGCGSYARVPDIVTSTEESYLTSVFSFSFLACTIDERSKQILSELVSS